MQPLATPLNVITVIPAAADLHRNGPLLSASRRLLICCCGTTSVLSVLLSSFDCNFAFICHVADYKVSEAGGNGPHALSV